jgi:hypothetical protein
MCVCVCLNFSRPLLEKIFIKVFEKFYKKILEKVIDFSIKIICIIKYNGNSIVLDNIMKIFIDMYIFLMCL